MAYKSIQLVISLCHHDLKQPTYVIMYPNPLIRFAIVCRKHWLPCRGECRRLNYTESIPLMALRLWLDIQRYIWQMCIIRIFVFSSPTLRNIWNTQLVQHDCQIPIVPMPFASWCLKFIRWVSYFLSKQRFSWLLSGHIGLPQLYWLMSLG